MHVTRPQQRKSSGFSIYRRIGGDAFHKAIEHLEQLQTEFPGLEVRAFESTRRQPAVQLINSKEIQHIDALHELEPAIALGGIFRANPALLETRHIRFNSTASTRNHEERYFLLIPSEEDAALLESMRLAVYKTLAGMVKVDFDIPKRTLDATVAYSRRIHPASEKEILDIISGDLPIDGDLLPAMSTPQPSNNLSL